LILKKNEWKRKEKEWRKKDSIFWIIWL